MHTAAQKGPLNTAVTVIAHPPSRWLISQFYHRHCHLKLQMIILMMISKQRKGEEKALLVTCNMHNGIKSFLKQHSNFQIFTRFYVNFVSKKVQKLRKYIFREFRDNSKLETNENAPLGMI